METDEIFEKIEIKNFTIDQTFAQYWIAYEINGEKRYHPIAMTPYNFFKLFEMEGIKITKEIDEKIQEEGIHFSKTTLIRHKGNVYHEYLQGEEGDDYSPIFCWVKLE